MLSFKLKNDWNSKIRKKLNVIMRLYVFIICLAANLAKFSGYSDHDSGGESVAEGSVSVGLYLTTMAGKELGVQQLQNIFSELPDVQPEQAGVRKTRFSKTGAFLGVFEQFIYFESFSDF